MSLAYQIDRFGEPACLRDINLESPGAGEVRLRLHACGLNFADLLMLNGKYQELPDPPFTLGMEMAGVVEACGPGVTLRPGDRVAAFASSGGLAEAAVVPERACTRIPDTMPFEHAAAFQITYGTSHLALDHRARLQPGETLLVLGAAGGVGLTAVEIGKRMGARVIACARGEKKLAVAQAAGADHLIDSTAPDLRTALKSLGGVDVVYDAVGGEGFDAALRATKPEGRLIPIGFASGSVPQIPANLLLVKNITVIGLYWGAYAKFAPQIMMQSMVQLMGWYAAGGLQPHVSHVLPLERTGEALDLLRSRASTGKVVVTMN